MPSEPTPTSQDGPPPLPDETLPADTLIGPYSLVRKLGQGGMAAVYLAEHTGLRKRVALKLLLPEMRRKPQVLARFLREGQAAATVRHPHIVDVTDVGTHQGVPFLVMEYLEGTSLADLLEREGALPATRTLDLLLPVLSAVAAAHRQGIVHRDLKPDNLFGPGRGAAASAAQGPAGPLLLRRRPGPGAVALRQPAGAGPP